MERKDQPLCGFPTISLSSQVVVRFRQGPRYVNSTDLDDLGLGTLRLWDQAADNLVARCTKSNSLTLLIRPAQALLGCEVIGFQLSTPDGISPTAWLAHPHTFSIVHQHLSTLLGAAPLYAVPDQDTLVAVHPDQPLEPVRQWLDNHQDPLLAQLVAYQHGFPGVSA